MAALPGRICTARWSSGWSCASALDHAVNEGHFLLQYQPIVDLATDEAVGFEALVRWHHPTAGVIAPDQFIEVAEESGLIVPMGRWVLEQALHTVAQWRRILPRTPPAVRQRERVASASSASPASSSRSGRRWSTPGCRRRR